jgi:hypothetical protein
MSDNERHPEKSYAALAYALGVARGVLGDVVVGQVDCGGVRRVYDATALVRIAESIGMKECDLSVDWDDHLSKDEKLKIQGYQRAEPSNPTSGSAGTPLGDSDVPEEPPSVS